MGTLITACTERIFLKELMPLAHLMFGEVRAVNDNELRFPVNPAVCPYHQSGRTADEARRPRRLDAFRIAQRLPPPLPPPLSPPWAHPSLGNLLRHQAFVNHTSLDSWVCSERPLLTNHPALHRSRLRVSPGFT